MLQLNSYHYGPGCQVPTTAALPQLLLLTRATKDWCYIGFADNAGEVVGNNAEGFPVSEESSQGAESWEGNGRKMVASDRSKQGCGAWWFGPPCRRGQILTSHRLAEWSQQQLQAISRGSLGRAAGAVSVGKPLTALWAKFHPTDPSQRHHRLAKSWASYSLPLDLYFLIYKIKII